MPEKRPVYVRNYLRLQPCKNNPSIKRFVQHGVGRREKVMVRCIEYGGFRFNVELMALARQIVRDMRRQGRV